MNYSDDISKIRHVQPGDPISGQVTSEPTRAIELRLRELEDAIYGRSSSATSTQLMLYNVTIKSDVGLNTAVFFNPNTSMYELAAATVTLVSGTFTPNPSALVVGIVTAKRGSKADVMVGGTALWGSTATKTELLNQLLVEGATGFKPGAVYYLSDYHPGQLTQYPPSLKIQVLVSSDLSFIVLPQYATPEAIQNVYTKPVGMLPVGAVRSLPPNQDQTIVVGFDALEKYDAVNNRWRSTADSSVDTFVDFGYMVADANVLVKPSSPVYVRIVVATDGTVTAFSAASLAALYAGGTLFSGSTVTSPDLAAVNSVNYGAVREYTVNDASRKNLGKISFKFTAYDLSCERHMVFKFPDSFQGWKATNVPVTPYATASISDTGTITSINVIEGSVGFTSAPAVVITDSNGGGGAGAQATATINEFGVVTGVQVTDAGLGYTAPVVSFDTNVSGVSVLNGGSGAVATALVTDGSISSAVISNAGTGYYQPPVVTVVDPLGVGSGARVAAVVFGGSIADLAIVSGGSGYSSVTPPVLHIKNQWNSTYDTVNNGPVLAGIVSQTPTTAPTLVPTYAPVTLQSVDVVSSGVGYTSNSVVTLQAGSGCTTPPAVHAVVDEDGHVVRVDIVNPGAGFTSTPVFTVTNAVGEHGNGAILQASIGTSVTGILVGTSGSGLLDPAQMAVGVPLKTLEVDTAGTGYLSAPAVTIAPPDLTIAQGGVQATADALLGGTIEAVHIVNAGTGYSQAAPPVVTITGDGSDAAIQLMVGPAGTIVGAEIINPGYGYTTIGYTVAGAGADLELGIDLAGTMVGEVVTTSITNAGAGYVSGHASVAVSGGTPTVAAVLVPIVAGDGTGSIIDISIVNAGSGYDSAPILTFSDPDTGTNRATAVAYLDGKSIVGFSLTNPGNGYSVPPTVTVDAPPSGVTAAGSAKIAGGTLMTVVGLRGAGGKRLAQAAPLSQGNNLQIRSYKDDFADVTKPTNAMWYYNMAADPELRALYPAVPVDKLSFYMNGVGLLVTTYGEAQKQVINPDADIAATRRTLLWTTLDADGCPWDAAVQHFISDTDATGRDCVVPATGPSSDLCWKLWCDVFRYETQRNRGWVDINKASKFFQTGRVASLAALSPLRLIDTVTGAESSEDGLPMTGQLLLVNDSQTSLFKGTGVQITLTNPGELQAIFQNTTGRMVALSSVLLTVVFQTNNQSVLPDASYAAEITIGTEAGNYRDIIGATSANVISTRLYAVNQVKELFPDANQPAPLIPPNGTVYLSVVQPAGSPISVQTAVAYIKGNVL